MEVCWMNLCLAVCPRCRYRYRLLLLPTGQFSPCWMTPNLSPLPVLLVRGGDRGIDKQAPRRSEYGHIPALATSVWADWTILTEVDYMT